MIHTPRRNRTHVASPLCVATLLSVAGCAGRLPPGATPATQPEPAAPRQPAPAENPPGLAIDPEATNFNYPYPVQFFALRSQGLTLNMAYMDVPPARKREQAPPAPAAAETSPPPAANGGTPAAPLAATDGTATDGADTQPVTIPGSANTTSPAAAGSESKASPAAAVSERCVVLLHGKNFSAASWATTIDALSKAGYRVIAPDQIGFGKSSKPGSYQYSFALLAHNTRALLESLGLSRCSVVGHSMGGMLAVRFALLYPAATERLVLVNPIGLEDYTLYVPYRTPDQWYADELKQTPETIREYQRVSYYAGHWEPEYEAQIQLSSGFTRHPDYSRVAWVSALTYDMIMTQPVVHDLPRLSVPTRLIIGTRDRTAVGRKYAIAQSAALMGEYAVLGKEARDAIPSARLIELPGVGHVPQIESFDAFWQALRRSLQ